MEKNKKLDIYISLLSYAEIIFIMILLLGPYFFFIAFMNNFVSMATINTGIIVTVLGTIGTAITGITKKKLIDEKWRNIE